jgi:transposase
MSNKPKNMSKIRIILEQLDKGIGYKTLSRSMKVSRNTIKSYIEKINIKGISICSCLLLNDEELETVFYSSEKEKVRYAKLKERDEWYKTELKKPHVTKQILWEEYKKIEGEAAYGQSQFNEYLYKWELQNNSTMTIGSKPGLKMEVDYAGDTLAYIDANGEEKRCQVLICMLPHSDLIYCEAQYDQTQMNFIEGVGRALIYIGGVPKQIISDNLKSAIKKADRYEPELTDLCEQMSIYYSTQMTATRVRKPRDKASVERSVDIVYKRIYAVIRNRTIGDLAELNTLIKTALEELNNRKMKRNKMSRWEEYTAYEKPYMQELKVSKILEVKKSRIYKVCKNYHLQLTEDKHYYSVPKEYVGEEVKLVYNSTEVEIYHKYKRIAIHKRVRIANKYSTAEGHMPANHQKAKEYGGYTEEQLISQAEKIGEHAKNAIKKILASNSFIEQGYNSALGVIHLVKKFEKERVEKACEILAESKVTYTSIKNLLENNMDKKGEKTIVKMEVIKHENLRHGKIINLK